MQGRNATEYTTDELIAMGDDRFADAVVENLHHAGAYKGPFQHPDVRARTLLALIEKLWFTDSQIEKQAEDPTYSIERYEKTLAFRRHLLAVVDLTERRISFDVPARVREASAWKQVLHEVLDEIEGGPDDDILDEFDIPFVEDLSLRSWLDIRRVKDPSRVKAKVVAA